MQVAKGYKQTEVGVIPEDWTCSDLGSLGRGVIGLTYSPHDVSDNGTLVLRSSNIQNDRLSYKDNVYVDMDVPNRAITQIDDILICVRNGSRRLIGKCAIIDQTVAGCAFGAFMTVYRSEHAHFVLHQFRSHIVKKQINDIMGATINQITNRDLASFLIPFPPTKAEQEAIAEALSDADSLIESLQQLIAKKRQIKQGAMQTLLHPKPDWEKKTLGYLFDFKNGLNKSKEFFGHGTPIVNYMDVFNKSSLSSRGIFGKVLLTSQERSNYEVRKGDVFFTRTSETTDEIGLASVMLNSPTDTVFSGFVLRARPKTDLLVDSYLGYALRSPHIRSQIVSKASYTTRALINGAALAKVNFSFPTDAEQTRIATILSDMDEEISALQTKLNKAQQIKQGMMSELLTGKTRLI
jgi:type I restriction enzyme S subunit